MIHNIEENIELIIKELGYTESDNLFYYDDLTISDISKVTGIKESTVKSLLKRSRNKLKLMLGDEWIYEQ